jgi:hypothetical protein
MRRVLRAGERLLLETFPSLRHVQMGRDALSHLQATFRGPARCARQAGSLRLVILNHFYDQDIDAFLKSDVDCEIWVLDHSHVRGVRPFYNPQPDLAEDHNGRRVRGMDAAARRHFVRAGVEHILGTARPDVVLCPSDVFYWFRPFIVEFQARGIPVVVQDKEGTLAPGPLTREFLDLIMRNLPPLADRYYFWGSVQHEHWTKAGLDPAKVRILGMPRSDFFFHPARHASPASLGLPADKRLITCFTFDANAYLLEYHGRQIGRPWLAMRRQLHEALKRLAIARPDTHIVVKCHPQSLETAEINEELAGAPANLSLMYGAVTAANLIVNSAVVIGFQSTAMMETMLTEKPLLYCGWAEEHPRYLDWLIPLPQSGACFLPGSAEELFTLTCRLLDGAVTLSEEMQQRRQEFARLYFKDTRGRAADHILLDIQENLVGGRFARPGLDENSAPSHRAVA